MIELFKNIDPEKTAFEKNGKIISYLTLLRIINARKGSVKADCLLTCADDFENLLNFLAIISVGKKAVFANKNCTLIQQNNWAKQFDLEILDKPLAECISKTESFSANASDLFLGILSSGTSGDSKLIWKDYQSWFAAFPHQSEIFKINSDDRILVLDALAYSANLNAVLHGLWLGATIVFSSLSNAKNWSKEFENQTISSAFLVPSHCRMLLHSDCELPQVKTLVTAGEKLDAKTANALMQKFPAACITEYYGAAELGHISYHQNQDIIDFPLSVGKAFPEVKIYIKDNIISVESPYVSPEYRNQATVFDFGEFDAHQNLILLGRQGRMFNRRGLNIFAEEIENAILLHPYVKEAVVFENRKNRIELTVSTAKALTKKDLHVFLLTKIAKEKLPNNISLISILPRNQHGKIDISALKKALAEEESLIFE